MVVACGTKWLVAVLSSDALIKFVSDSARDVTGYSVPDLIGRPLIQILEDESALRLTRMLAEVEENGGWEGDIIHRSRDGQRWPAYSVISKLNTPTHTGYILFSHLSWSERNNQAEQSMVERIADILRNYAHDLNNPLTVMMGFTQLLMLNENCSGKMRNDVEKIYAEMQRVIDIVGQMHEYAYSLYRKPMDGC